MNSAGISLVCNGGAARVLAHAALALLHIGSAVAQECVSEVVSHVPVRVVYDAARTSGASSALLFERSDSGVLSARDGADGRLLWSFEPPELAAASATTGLMTDLAVLRFDANQDGFIDADGDDKVWLYFGLKRGGAHYYALDVTDRTPRVLWKTGVETMEGLAEAWSTPTIARVRAGGARQNGEHLVIILGGGFAGDSASAGNAGNRLFMLDAATGAVLWHAGDQSTADLVLSRMTHGVASRVAVLDTDGDGFADRLYASDTGGRVWRFDVWNGRTPTGLITGGVFASLGIADSPPDSASPSDARRFFNAPDVALIQKRGMEPYYNLAIGSGDASNRLSTSVRDRFYSIRDREPFVRRSQAACDAAQVIVDADLTDISGSPQAARVADDAPGWKLDLTLNGAGEKVLAESLTVDGVVLFTTHQPAQGLDTSGCALPGTNRVYAVRVESGDAALDLDGDLQITTADLFSTLAQTGVVDGPRLELAMPADYDLPGLPPPPTGVPGVPAGNSPHPVARCFVGAESMSRCVPLGTTIRTFWKRELVN